MKKLTLRDLNKEELLEIVEAVVDSLPGIMECFSEEVIAGAIISRKAAEVRKLEKRLEPLRAAHARARSEKTKNKILRQAHPLAKRGKRLVDEISALTKRYPPKKEAKK